MSGGSYNYLGQRLADEINGLACGDFDCMEDRLDGISMEHPEARSAYMATYELSMMLEECRALAEKLAPVFHAVEWRDSADWGEDQMLEALADFHYESNPIRWSATAEGSK